MKPKPNFKRILAPLVVAAAAAAAAGCTTPTDRDFTPSKVSESAPARTGAATVPTGGGNNPVGSTRSQAVMPGSGPSSASTTLPATTGPASTPTAGQGASAPYRQAEAMNRLPQSPSSVSESAPARTGASTVPTERLWHQADVNRDGYVDRAEFNHFMANGSWRNR